MGEEVPLHVSEKWIDILENEEDKKHKTHCYSYDRDANQMVNQSSADSSTSFANPQKEMVKKLSSASNSCPRSWESRNRHPVHLEEDTPHDEYFDDILNCGEGFASDDNEGDANDHPAIGVSKQNEQDMTDLASSILDTVGDDSNFRHRSTWNTAYKPPKLSISDDDQPVSPSNCNWQRLVHHRALAAISSKIHPWLNRKTAFACARR